MARTVRSTPTFLFFFILLLTVAPTPSHSFFTSYNQYRNIISLAHSLMIGVANLRASRGDVAGSERARAIADKLERGLGLGFWSFAWSAGWDYATSFAWRELSVKELYGAVSDMNELLSGFSELTRLKSEAARAAWVGRNYQNVLILSKSLSGKLLKAFRKSEVRKVVEIVQREVIEGGLLKDCIELGSNDLKSLIPLLKDLVSSFSSSSSSSTTHSHSDL